MSTGPVYLEVSDTAGRYCMLQFVDAWTNNFAYVGYRATGTRAGSYLVVPDWDGSPGEGEQVIGFPTTVGSSIGRWAVDRQSDVAAVRELQSQLTLTPIRRIN